MRRIFLWLRYVFAWHPVRETGVWTYWENALTGQRAVSRSGSGYQPIDDRWLNRLSSIPSEPPRRGTGGFR